MIGPRRNLAAVTTDMQTLAGTDCSRLSTRECDRFMM
jgi:hypothetical protein